MKCFTPLSEEKLKGPSCCCWITHQVILKRLRELEWKLFPPPNYTNLKQPCDIGIIATLKKGTSIYILEMLCYFKPWWSYQSSHETKWFQTKAEAQLVLIIESLPIFNLNNCITSPGLYMLIFQIFLVICFVYVSSNPNN